MGHFCVLYREGRRRKRQPPPRRHLASQAEADGLQKSANGPAKRVAGEIGTGHGGSAEAVLAEADGNRTRGGEPGGGGRESNPPTGISRRTDFEDREGHQSPFASRAELNSRWSERVKV